MELFLHLQSYRNETISKLTGEIQKINQTFSKYEADIAIIKNVNTLLSNQLNGTEIQCWANQKRI